MADKSTLLKTFNTQFFAFLKDIMVIFPDNKDLEPVWWNRVAELEVLRRGYVGEGG